MAAAADDAMQNENRGNADANEHTGQQPSALVAMSGGVDSSVAALLLHESGFRVIGITCKLFGNDDILLEGAQSTCCSLDDVEDARQACRRLGVPHYTFNLASAFKHQVIDRFCESYLAGATPNPCIDCNRYIKFQALQQRRRELGFDYVATGHYARRVYDESSGRYLLLRGADPAKDQSYVLFHLSQDTLANMLFPLGDLRKHEVRNLAREHGFASAEKAESQDICFVPADDYAHFIERYRSRSGKDGAGESDRGGLRTLEPGPIKDMSGHVIGMHQGIARYTIGQRKGLGIAAREPLYVCEKDAATNTLVVGTARDTLIRRVVARDINLIAVERLNGSLRVTAKTHYRQTAQPAIVRQSAEDILEVEFLSPQAPCAPGQALVLYDGDIVIGGGTICSSS